VGLIAPGTVVSHRTACENKRSPDGSVFVTGEYARQVTLPGLIIRHRRVLGPLNTMRPSLVHYHWRRARGGC